MENLDKLSAFKPLLWVLSVVGFFGVNGVFLYYLFFRPGVVDAANANPVSMVFIGEAFLLMFVLAWLIRLFEFEKPGWIGFIVMSIAGSLAFSIPFFLLLHVGKKQHQA